MRRDRTLIQLIHQFFQQVLQFRNQAFNRLFNQLLHRPVMRRVGQGLVLIGVGWLIVSAIALAQAAMQPTDGILVLGGSIRREIYAAELSTLHPELPILISKGSEPPCIRKIFERDQTPVHRVWLEQCADSTFGNFYFGLPILQSWGVRHVQLVTSPTHLPRALWLARVMLSSHGIWVTPNLVEEMGVPGNQEAWWKTILDVSRGGFWAIASLFYQAQCDDVLPLSQVDVSNWDSQDVQCERQAGLDN